MKRSLLTATLCLCSLSLQSCTAFLTDGDGHTAYARDIIKEPAPATRPDVTFTLTHKDDSQDHFLQMGGISRTIEAEMNKSGLFGKVKFVEKNDPKASLHYDYYVRTDGPSYLKAIGLGLISGFTFTVVPTWLNYEADWQLSVYKDGKEVYNDSSEQESLIVYWLPCAVTFPYSFIQEGNLQTRAINYFLSETQKKGIIK